MNIICWIFGHYWQESWDIKVTRWTHKCGRCFKTVIMEDPDEVWVHHRELYEHKKRICCCYHPKILTKQ